MQVHDYQRRQQAERTKADIWANTVIARELACRAWAIAMCGQVCQPRDLDGNPISQN